MGGQRGGEDVSSTEIEMQSRCNQFTRIACGGMEGRKEAGICFHKHRRKHTESDIKLANEPDKEVLSAT